MFFGELFDIINLVIFVTKEQEMSTTATEKEQLGLLIKIVNRLDKLENLNSEISNLNASTNDLSKDVSKLCSDYQNVSVKVSGLSEQVTKLMDPETGVYPKIFKIDSDINRLSLKLTEEKDKDKDKATEQKELNEITKQLKIVGGGKELEKAKKAIDFHESFSKLMWIAFGGITIQIIGIIITFLKK